MTSYDEKFVNDVVDKLKKQGLFDQFRKECLSDIDTKPAYQNLQTRVQGAVDRFLSNHKWTQQLKKNLLRDSLRKHLNELPMLSNGIDRVVDQVINPKFISDITPLIDNITCQHLGIDYDEWKKNKEEQDKIITDAKIPSLLEIDTSIPSYSKPGAQTTFYPRQNHSTQNSFTNLHFHNPNYDMTNNYPPFNPYTMHPFAEHFYNSSQQWPLGPIHPDFGVPLPTMPYIPEPAPPLPEDDPQQHVVASKLPQNQFFENNTEHDVKVEEPQEISVISSDDIVNETSQNKSYHFEWENYDTNAISDVSVSSVHTSDISSLDDYDDDDDNLDEMKNEEDDKYTELNEENVPIIVENSSPSKPKMDLPSSKKVVQRSKAEMKEERRERKINEKKRMLWQKMNNSLHEEIETENILIEEEFATVEEEIIKDDSSFNLRDKYITIDEASSDEGNKESASNAARSKTSLNDDNFRNFNLNKANNLCKVDNNRISLYNDKYVVSESNLNMEDVENINLPETKLYDSTISNYTASNVIDTPRLSQISDIKKGHNLQENKQALSGENINLQHGFDRGTNIRVKNIEATGLVDFDLQDDNTDLLTEKIIGGERQVELEKYDIIDDVSGSEDDDDNILDNAIDDRNSKSCSEEDDELKKNEFSRFKSQMRNCSSSSIDSDVNIGKYSHHKRSKSKDAKIANSNIELKRNNPSTRSFKHSKYSRKDSANHKSIRSLSRQRNSVDSESHSRHNQNSKSKTHYKYDSKSHKDEASGSKAQKVVSDSCRSYKDNGDNNKDNNKLPKDRDTSSGKSLKEDCYKVGFMSRRSDRSTHSHKDSSKSHRIDDYKDSSKPRNNSSDMKSLRQYQDKVHKKSMEKSLNKSHVTQAIKKQSDRELSPITKRLRR